MWKNAKKRISLLTAAAMICSLAAAPVYAEEEDAASVFTEVEQQENDSVVTTLRNDNGSSVALMTPVGQTTVTVWLSSSAAEKAVSGDAVKLPVQGLHASQNIDHAPAVTVNTSGVNGVKVDIPLETKNSGIVAVLVMPDGTERIIKHTIPTQDGIAIRVDSGDSIKILDNSISFTDTENHWAADAVDFVSARGLCYGAKANVFSPDAEMTRGMLAAILARYADVDTTGGTTWYEKGAAWAMANGLSDGTSMDDNITREQLITIMYRYAILEGKRKGTYANLHGYMDADRVSSWAADAMSWAVGVGLIKGVTPVTLSPQGNVTRAQVAAIFMHYEELFGL